MKNLSFSTLLLLLALSGCKNNNVNQETSTIELEKPQFSLTEIWATDTLMTTCESVLYDDAREVLYVSNINGNPDEKNGKGFISKLSLEGEILTQQWITGINAPKGLGIFENLLYITDIDELVIIDIEKEVIYKKIPVEGAVFLNDIDIDSKGVVYISDSGTGKIHKYENESISDWITEGLMSPNGIFIEKDRILITSSGSADLKIIDPETTETKIVTTEIGHGDGVEFTGMEGFYLTSDWSGEIFLIYPDYSKESLLNTKEQKKNTADIGYNLKEMIVYVPTFFDNRVVAYQLQEK